MALEDLREIIATGEMGSERFGSPVFKAAWTWALINMNDALKAAEALGRRCTITQDVAPFGRERDLAALIATARAAACHIDSEQRRQVVGEAKFNFGWNLVGGPGGFGLIGADPIGPVNPYADDLMLQIGVVPLLYRRNVQVCVNWIEARTDAKGNFFQGIG